MKNERPIEVGDVVKVVKRAYAKGSGCEECMEDHKEFFQVGTTGVVVRIQDTPHQQLKVDFNRGKKGQYVFTHGKWWCDYSEIKRVGRVRNV